MSDERWMLEPLRKQLADAELHVVGLRASIAAIEGHPESREVPAAEPERLAAWLENHVAGVRQAASRDRSGGVSFWPTQEWVTNMAAIQVALRGAAPAAEPPVMHEERENDVLCCCGDHLRPTGGVRRPERDAGLDDDPLAYAIRANLDRNEPRMIDGIPRRAQMLYWTPAEQAIYDAVQAVEEAGADERLTRAVILLGEARELVADYVDALLQRDAGEAP